MQTAAFDGDCRKCGQPGHRARDCRLPAAPAAVSAANGDSAAFRGQCRVCKAHGHMAKDCPAKSAAAPMRKPPAPAVPAASIAPAAVTSASTAFAGLCRKCKQPGHMARDCPAEERKEAHPAPAPAAAPVAAAPVAAAAAAGQQPFRGACRKCGQPGHMARSCPAGAEAARPASAPGLTPASARSAAPARPAPPVRAPAAVERSDGEESGEGESAWPVHLTRERFSSLAGAVAAPLLLGIAEVLRYEYLTVVQAASMPAIAAGRDVLAKAKTGTGKTLAFLIPAVDRLLRLRANGAVSAAPALLVLSPTRELAQQIATEAGKLLSHARGVTVGCVVGGTNINSERTRLARSPPDVLVATPGRLQDHLQGTPGFAASCARLHTLVFDEADRLLDMGFRADIERILRALPSAQARQTLLFSATLPAAVQEMAALALKRDHDFIDTVGDEDAQTNVQVVQESLVVPPEEQLATLMEVVERRRREPAYKIIVFCTTARLAGYLAELFNTSGVPALEIHSRKSQAHRTRTSEQFRVGKNLLLFSSDVSARGLDYPDVSCIIQVGVTEREQYIHRLGRTARAGKAGYGLLLLTSAEAFLLRELSDLPIAPAAPVVPTAATALRLARTIQNTERDGELKQRAEQAYQSWLGFYKGYLRQLRWTPIQLVENANRLAQMLGLREPPTLTKKCVGMMGLKGVPGLRVA